MFSALLGMNPAAAFAKEGFGGSKDSVRMERLVPAAVTLGASRFAVRAGGPEAGTAWSRQLEVQLEKEIAARNRELIADQSEPEVLIELTILRKRLTERLEDKPERERRQIGIAPNGNSIFQSVEVTAQFRVILHEVSVSFETIQAATGTVLDSGSIEAPFEGRFRDGKNAPELATLEADAMAKVVDGIARRVTPEKQRILVPLPKGRLEAFAALARAGQWRGYRDAVAALAPSPAAEEEAYRQYALATAGEALAYAATGMAERLEFLQLAESQYAAAIAAHPGEKIFARKSEAKEGAAAAPAGLERVRTALDSFRKSESARSPAVAGPAAAAGPAERAAVGGAMDNAAVIHMVREGKGGYAILTAMKAAPALSFDFSPQGLAQLSAAGVDPKIVGYMRELSLRE